MENDGSNLSRIARPLCREPWQGYYILRRGVMPCCYGHKAIAPMADWKTAWNSEALQEMRSCLARGELSAYCLLSLSCPIVRRYLAEHPDAAAVPDTAPREKPATAVEPEAAPPRAHALPLRIINRALGRLPARVYRRLRKTAAMD